MPNFELAEYLESCSLDLVVMVVSAISAGKSIGPLSVLLLTSLRYTEAKLCSQILFNGCSEKKN